MRSAWSAMRTNMPSASAVEYTATASQPSSCSARITRTATSPRFATSTRENISGEQPSEGVERRADERLELEQELAELNGPAVLGVDRAPEPLRLRLQLVEELHRLEQAERLPGRDRVAHLDERRRARFGGAVEDADHRRLDGDETVRRAAARSDRSAQVVGAADPDGHRLRLLRPPHGDAHSVLLDRDLADAGLLDDPHDLADPLRPRALERRLELVAAAAAPADRAHQPPGALAEQPEQQQLLLARREALGLRARLVERRDVQRRRLRVAGEPDGAAHVRIDRSGRRPPLALEQRAHLVDHDRVPRRREDVQQRLGAEDLPDRRRER